MIDRCINDDAFYNEYIDEKINELCQYACENTSFYKDFRSKSISEISVINKNISFLDSTQFQSKEFTGKTLLEMSTSGLTDRPFKISQDSMKRNQVLAEVLFFSKLVGYRPGKNLFI